MERATQRDGIVVFSVLFFALLALILILNDGRFIYTLDDPYIHLALAQKIGQGHYGINFGESSAPCSSLLWPLLLAPFSTARFFEYVPLAANFLASLGVVAALGGALEACLPPGRGGFLVWVKAQGLLLLLVLFCNLPWLAFSGMEHSLQILCSVVLVRGLARERSSGRVSAALAAAIIVGPLLRYESLALSLPAMAYLGWRGHAKAALACALSVGLPLAAFSAFLWSRGLGVLPTSIVVKAHGVGGEGIAGLVLRNAAGNLAMLRVQQAPAMILAATLLLLLAGWRRFDAGKRSLAAVVAAAIVLHCLFGSIDGRYEFHVVAPALLCLLYVYRDGVRGYLFSRPLPPLPSFAVLLLVAVPALVLPCVRCALQIPLESNNIYEQQYQMGRFAQAYYAAPVAVNDLGLVSFGNKNYVLDLWGLGSLRAYALRRDAGADPAWMQALCEEHSVRLAMLYPDWFGSVPPSWVLLGTLNLGKARLAAFRSSVSFYALDPATAAIALADLKRFSQDLPEDVHFIFAAGRALPVR